MKSLAKAVAGLLLVPTVLAAAPSEIDTEFALRHDSNVYRFNNTTGEQSGTGIEYGLEWSRDFIEERWRKLELKAGFSGRWYEGKASDASRYKLGVGLSGKVSARVKEASVKRSNKWEVGWRYRDSTFVSRTSGARAQSGGESIADRFDSHTLAAGYEVVRPIAGDRYWAAQIAARFKDYVEDYQALALDRLDYSALEFEPAYGVDGKPGAWEISLPLGFRRYVDRRNENQSGVDQMGSDLEYLSYGVASEWVHALTTESEFGLRGRYEQRFDNGGGYRDRTKYSLELGYERLLDADSALATSAKWTSRTFDRSSAGGEQINEPEPERVGYEIEVSYARALRGWAADAFADLRWGSFENDANEAFSYDRLELTVGLEKEF